MYDNYYINEQSILDTKYLDTVNTKEANSNMKQDKSSLWLDNLINSKSFENILLEDLNSNYYNNTN